MFLTGSEFLLVDRISISFHQNMSEFERRPIAHTCGATLELSSNYNFSERTIPTCIFLIQQLIYQTNQTSYKKKQYSITVNVKLATQ